MHKESLKKLPKIDEIMLVLEKRGTLERAPRDVVLSTCRSVVGDVRGLILSAKEDDTDILVPSLDEVAATVAEKIENIRRYSFRRVVNATGIILHTNLGRAPLCKEALERISEVSCGYSNLEFDLEKGKRGLRYDHVQKILCELSGAEDALVVNNNAAAVLLVLNTLSEGKEAIVSRGELIEIGGEFRIPEVMEKSGAILKEVGTTNRTHLSDYNNAVNKNTGLILKVHTSNFKIVGFTEEIGLPALVDIGKRKEIPVMNDLGSGCFVELDRYGFEKEPTIQEVLKTGVDVVTFSGDKLLGGPQAGIILGSKNILGKIKGNPLNRALRIDKLTLAALEATMKQYLNGEGALSNIRILRSITEPLADVEKRAEKLLTLLQELDSEGVVLTLKKGASMTGGGALPTQEIPTMLLSVKSSRISANSMDEHLRHCDVPVVVRISDDEVLLDLRTIDEEEFKFIETGLQSIYLPIAN
ncbi:MAG: L-seryl-tRNA(Sec) selenium transferase [Syntrophales bacterium]|nr:L-seryl-tRNA(Sec) selenium transferase [Syntrophales bacterium]